MTRAGGGTATMDVRLAVGGLLTRNAVLSTLLVNYADRLEEGWPGRGASTASCFIVPAWWSVGQRPTATTAPHLLSVTAHASLSDPDHAVNLDSILRLLQGVLTDDHARASITARRLVTSDDQASGDPDTATRVGIWEITPVLSRAAGGTQGRLLPWPDCRAVLDARGLAPATAGLN
jgi:hypothetical protein